MSPIIRRHSRQGLQVKPRVETAERRRTDLLDAAERIVLAKGTAKLTVDEVTTRAQVAKGTFYLYFRSKEQLIAALRERLVDDLTARQAAELESLAPDDWAARLQRWMESSIRGFLAQADLHDALFSHTDTAEQTRHGHVADPETNRHAALLTEILEGGTAAGGFTLANPKVSAVLLYNLMHGTADYLVEQNAHHETAASDVDAVIAESLTLCRRYIRPGEPTWE